MKNVIKPIGDLIAKIIGDDNNRFFALLLFIALMFALWLNYQRDRSQHSDSESRPYQEITSGLK